MMERGSSRWWFVLLLVALVSVRWQRYMSWHVVLNQHNMEQATRLELEAQHLEHDSITSSLQAVLHKHQGEALLEQSAQLYNTSVQEKKSYEYEHELALEYEELFERATKASDECRERLEEEEEVSKEAHEKLQGYLEDLSRLQQQHQEFCINHWWTPMWYCDLVAKWTGLVREEVEAAMNAQGGNDTAVQADMEEKMDQALEEVLEKNITVLNGLQQNATQEAIGFKKAYLRDEQHAKELDSKAKELLTQSTVETEDAKRETEQANKAKLEAEEFLNMAQYHGKWARCFATLSTIASLLVLYCMLLHICHLVSSMVMPSPSRSGYEEMPDTTSKPPHDDESTVASSIASEQSPLVDHESLSLSSSSDFSAYVTVDLNDSHTMTTTSSVSFLSSAAISRIVQETLDRIRTHSKKIELLGAIIVVVCLGHVLWSYTLPGFCASLAS